MEDDDWDNDGDAFGDDDNAGSDDEPNDAFAGQVVESKQDYKVLSVAQVAEELTALLKDLASVLHVSTDVASVLLRRNRWNKEAVMTAFFEDRDGILAKNGVLLPPEADPAPSDKSQITCRICDDPIPIQNTSSLGCAHRFCKPCWHDYLLDKVEQGKVALQARCPMYKCTYSVLDSFYETFVSEKYDKFRDFLLRAYVEDSKRLKWCPAARCDRVVQATGRVSTVKCDCGSKFCFMCGDEAHDPATCNQLQAWLEKCRNESETAHWIISNTKRCPQCSIRIEKNQGCNHIICRECKHEFCWVCSGPWADHGQSTGGFYKCNKYAPKAPAKGPEAEAKAELERYLHYYQRYHNHDQAKNFAAKSREEAEQKMARLRESKGAAWADVQFLMNALEQVQECRRVLKYTYVFGYYLPNGSEKTLFEFLQQDLEKNTEHLSELCETPIEHINSAEVVNHSRVTAKFMDSLLEGISNGLTA